MVDILIASHTIHNYHTRNIMANTNTEHYVNLLIDIYDQTRTKLIEKYGLGDYSTIAAQLTTATVTAMIGEGTVNAIENLCDNLTDIEEVIGSSSSIELRKLMHSEALAHYNQEKKKHDSKDKDDK